MTRAEPIAAAVLATAVLASAVGVVYAKYLTRAEFVRLQEARGQRDAFDVEWIRLRLEEASLTTHSRIEDSARRTLGMHLPAMDEIRILEVPDRGRD